jgi:hypothetical protein
MLMLNTCQSGRHSINGPADLRPNGRCIHCSREAQKKYRQSCRDARKRLQAIEALIA